jgi:hypothetical protein
MFMLTLRCTWGAPDVNMNAQIKWVRPHTVISVYCQNFTAFPCAKYVIASLCLLTHSTHKQGHLNLESFLTLNKVWVLSRTPDLTQLT